MDINSHSFVSELPFYLFLLLFVSYWIWCFLNAMFHKGSLVKTKAHYQESFVTKNHSTETFKAIVQFAIRNGYKIDDIDEQKLSVVLNERMTLASYGSLYLIYVHENAGKTSVDIGATSKLGKFSLINPLTKAIVKFRLDEMVSNIKDELVAYDTKK